MNDVILALSWGACKDLSLQRMLNACKKNTVKQYLKNFFFLSGCPPSLVMAEGLDTSAP